MDIMDIIHIAEEYGDRIIKAAEVNDCNSIYDGKKEIKYEVVIGSEDGRITKYGIGKDNEIWLKYVYDEDGMTAHEYDELYEILMPREYYEDVRHESVGEGDEKVFEMPMEKGIGIENASGF